MIRSLFLVSALLLTSQARAEPARDERARAGGADAVELHRYGWQVAAADGVGVAFLVGAFGSDSPSLLVGSGVAWGLGGPLVHLAHRNYRGAGLSLGLRVGLPTLGVALGALIGSDSSSSSECTGPEACWDLDLGPGFGLGVLGLLSAQVVDWTILSRAPVRRQDGGALTWAPTLAPLRRGAALGVAGRF